MCVFLFQALKELVPLLDESIFLRIWDYPNVCFHAFHEDLELPKCLFPCSSRGFGTAQMSVSVFCEKYRMGGGKLGFMGSVECLMKNWVGGE